MLRVRLYPLTTSWWWAVALLLFAIPPTSLGFSPRFATPTPPTGSLAAARFHRCLAPQQPFAGTPLCRWRGIRGLPQDRLGRNQCRTGRGAPRMLANGGGTGGGGTDIIEVRSGSFVPSLSALCLECFYGGVGVLDFVNPLAGVQRLLLQQQVEKDLASRIQKYQKRDADGVMSGVCLSAVDSETGELQGFVDVSLTLYSEHTNRFDVGRGPGTKAFEVGTYRRPYLANLCVSPKYQRRGIARSLIQAVEEAVLGFYREGDAPKEHPPAGEELDEGADAESGELEGRAVKSWEGKPLWVEGLWLQVAEGNTAALSLYESMGYKVAWTEDDAREVVRSALSYDFATVSRVCLYKDLRARGGGGT